MAQQTINVGAAPNDGTGTPLRTAFQYTNSNFTELYTAVGPSGNNIVVPGNATISGDLTVDTNAFFVNSANNRVGIGTASPAATFSALIGSEFLHFGFGANNDNYYTVGASGTHIWRSSSTEQMRLNSTGLGVGGSPSTRFEVFSGFIKNTATTGSAQIIANNTGGVFTLAKDSSTGGNFTGTAYASVLYSDGAVPVCIFSNGSERLRIDSSGNLGIGVASPGVKLDIGGAGSQQFRIQMSGQADTRVISDTGAGIIGTYSNHQLIIRSNSITAITVDTSQNVGIGVVPGYKLDVNGTGKASSGWGVGDSSGNLSGTFINESNVSKSLTINADPGNAGANSLMQFKVDGSTHLTIDSSGNVISNVAGTAPTLATNSQMVFNLTSNTNLRISVRGTDGVTRTANITLA